MKSPLLYLLEVLFCSGLLMALYRVLLLRKVSYAACRRFLVAAVLLSVVIPVLDIPVYPARTVVYPLPLIAAPEKDAVELQSVEPVAQPETDFSGELTATPLDWPKVGRIVVGVLYGATSILLLALFAVHLVAIARLRRRSRLTDCGEYTLAEYPSIKAPFSFLRTVFLGDGYEPRFRAIVLRHEVSHIRHHHSFERLFMECVRCLFWFNPFVWIAGCWLQEVQEWEADRDVIEAGYDVTEYRTLIFRQLFGYSPDIACGLKHSFTLNRFVMMTQFKERRFAFLRLGAAIPVVAGMMLLCSFTAKSPATDSPTVTFRVAEGGALTCENRQIPADELSQYIADKRDSLPEKVRSKMEVRFVDDASSYNLHRAISPLRSDKPLGKFGKNRVGVHRGVDIHAAEGTTVVAAADGEVVETGYDASGWGHYVRINHGCCTTFYAHLATCDVTTGMQVSGGDKIGTVGATGLATGPHLHFELLADNQPIDPESVFDFSNNSNTSSDTAVIEVKSDGTLRLNGTPVAISSLQSRLETWRDALAAAQPRATILADDAIEMGRINDIKQVLRKAKILRVFYSGTQGGVNCVLPPAVSGSGVSVTEAVAVVPNDAFSEKEPRVFRVKERNFYQVSVSQKGAVLAGQFGKLEAMTDAELVAHIRTFLLNVADNPEMPEKEVQTFVLPDGRKEGYSTSRGLVSLRMNRSTSFAAYLQAQQTIQAAFDSLRNDLSLRWFGVERALLTREQREVVDRAVPMRISEAETSR